MTNLVDLSTHVNFTVESTEMSRGGLAARRGEDRFGEGWRGGVLVWKKGNARNSGG